MSYILSCLIICVIINYHQTQPNQHFCHFLPFVQSAQIQGCIFYTHSQSCQQVSFRTRIRAFLCFGYRCHTPLLHSNKKTKPHSELRFRILCLFFKPFTRKKANRTLHRVFGIAPRLIFIAVVKLLTKMRYVTAQLIQICIGRK